MRQVVVAEYLSLDGIGEDPGRIGAFERRGWVIPYHDDELAACMLDQLLVSDALLLGRSTYEGFVTTWPARSGDPIADRMNSLPKLVASTTLAEPLEWNANVLRGDVADEIEKRKQQSGGNLLVYGSRTLVHTLMQRDLVDVYQLMLVPLFLGSGRRWFGDGRQMPLALADVTTTSAGVVMLTYERAAEASDRSKMADAGQGDWWLRRRHPRLEPSARSRSPR